jgi:hypothetical protein
MWVSGKYGYRVEPVIASGIFAIGSHLAGIIDEKNISHKNRLQEALADCLCTFRII